MDPSNIISNPPVRFKASATRLVWPKADRMIPDPTLTRATPSSFKRATGGVPLTASTLTGNCSASTNLAIRSSATIPGMNRQSRTRVAIGFQSLAGPFETRGLVADLQ